MFRTADASTMSFMVVKVIWTVAVLAALMLLVRGLWANFYFEPTDLALAEARRGRFMVVGACLLLTGAAWFAVFAARWPVWVGIALAAPVALVLLGRGVVAVLAVRARG